jgi:penicillin-insensitive murein endopeptidase
MRTALPLSIAASWALLAPAARGAPSFWTSVAEPSGGPPRVIGAYGGACLAGAVALPLDGPGYQAVDASRRRHFGHPALVGFIADLGRAVAAGHLGTMLVGDMAQPRGGPMSFGHVSHQGGLDVDVWFRLDVSPLPVAKRDGIPQPSVVDAATGRIDPHRWTERHARLVHLAAIDPRVSRVFVGAAIKRDLCERSWPERGWLNRVRPWPGHDDHLHVRLRCPPDSPGCIGQPALPAGEGCAAADLELALARERAQGRRPYPEPNRVLPPACATVLTAAR